MNAVIRPVTMALMSMLVCVNSHDNGDLGGVMHSRLLPEPFAFRDIVELIGKMDEVFDAYSFPQTFFAKRTFGEVKTGNCTLPKGGVIYMSQQETGPPAQGAKGTFLVSVQFRQNATWQGTIAWVDKDKKQRFRSALEMIKLIDEALTEAAGDEEQVTWESSPEPE